MLRKINYILILASLVVLSSCGASKRFSYLNDLEKLETVDVTAEPDLKVSPNDRLEITVTCKNPVLAAPFNVIGGATGSIDAGTVAGAVSSSEKGYLVDKNGEITFPVLGTIHVGGLTLAEVKETIENEIKSRNYITEPIVLVDFVNFQITVLGEVNNKGNFIVKDNRINILQAIALAGDLPNSAVLDDIMVIRTEGNTRTAYTISVKTKDCFNSPAFYLQQNDIVYVKPSRAKLAPASELALTITSTVMSGLSAIASILYWTVGRK